MSTLAVILIVIGALIVALAQQKPPEDQLELEQQLSRGVDARDAFCRQAVRKKRYALARWLPLLAA